VGWLHMGALLLSVLFSYFIITKLDFMKPRGKWLGVAIFLVLLAALAYALAFFIHETVKALPRIAERAVRPLSNGRSTIKSNYRSLTWTA